MKNILLVGLGGSLGSMLRYAVTLAARRASSHPFPLQTLWVNVGGCLLIGLIGGLCEHRNLFGHEARLIILVGLFGGFTTFSTFGYETLSLWRGQQPLLAFSNVALHVTLSLFAVWGGYAIANS